MFDISPHYRYPARTIPTQSSAMDGLIDELRVWPYKRSSAQIHDNYRLGADGN